MVKTDGPIAAKDTTLYVRTDGAVEVRYSHLNEEDGLQYGYIYDVAEGKAVSPVMPLAAFTKFDVFEVVDDPEIIAALSEGEEDAAEAEGDGTEDIGKALMSVLVKDDKVVALWYEITGIDEANYRANRQWQQDPAGADIEDAEENFIAPEKMREVTALFDENPDQLLENLEKYEASEEYLRVVLPYMYSEPYQQ